VGTSKARTISQHGCSTSGGTRHRDPLTEEEQKKEEEEKEKKKKKKPRTWTDSLLRIKQRKRDMRFDTLKREGRRPLGRPRHRCEDNIKWIFRKWDVRIWNGSSWLRIGTSGGHL
jgi:hypothetical protein